MDRIWVVCGPVVAPGPDVWDLCSTWFRATSQCRWLTLNMCDVLDTLWLVPGCLKFSKEFSQSQRVSRDDAGKSRRTESKTTSEKRLSCSAQCENHPSSSSPSSSSLTTVGVAMNPGAHHLSSMLVHTPTLPLALVTLHLLVVAVLIAAGDVHSCETHTHTHTCKRMATC